MENWILSALVFLPLAGALAVWALPSAFSKWLNISMLSIELLLSALATWLFKYGADAPAGFGNFSSYQLAQKLDWITLPLGKYGTLSIDYAVGVDGLSISMVLLSGIVLWIGALSSLEIKDNQKGYYALYLLLSSAIMGCFVALDFFLFFLFFEFMLLPMYFLIGLWGGERREYASVKFFIYTLIGSVFILLVMVGLYSSAIDPVETAQRIGAVGHGNLQQMLAQGQLPVGGKVHTFRFDYLMDANNYLPNSLLAPNGTGSFMGIGLRPLAFLLLLLGFAIKLPAVPLHTWLPDAHVEAPTAISVVLAGILLKIGGYGLIRIGYAIFPAEAMQYAWWVGLLGVVAIVYAAFVALGTNNLKKMIAYSSVSHMGFVLLGLASASHEGIAGAIFQLFSHGIISPMLFLVAGVLYSRTHQLSIGSYRGLAQQMPQYAGFVAIAFFASLGLPGFSGFVAELLALLGAFQSQLPHWMPIVAALGLVIGAAYYLWAFQRMFLGAFSLKQPLEAQALTPLSAREWAMLAPLALGTLVLGIFPSLLLDMLSPTVNAIVNWLSATALP